MTIPKQESLTTEQLGDALLRTVQQMSEREKADLRQRLNAQFKKCPCGSHQKVLRTFNGQCCVDCATADQMSYHLWMVGLRDTPIEPCRN